MIDPDIPLIDLHRHLDGNVRIATIIDLARKNDLPLPAATIDALRPHVQITTPVSGVMDFISKMNWMVEVLVDYDACFQIAHENVEDAKNEGLDYIELRFSPFFMARPHDLAPRGVVEAVVEGVKQGVIDFGIPVKIIGIISRTYGPDSGWDELNALLSRKDDLVGLDLAGDEAKMPGKLFVDHFAKARDVGWQITVHAGESRGPESIWYAITKLNAIRIGHGTSAIKDGKLLDHLRDHQIGIEANITSNVQTTTVNDYPNHPIKFFLNHGIKATINTDDPGVSGIDLFHEYNIAAVQAGLTRASIRQAQKNAFDIAFLNEQERTEILLRKRRAE